MISGQILDGKNVLEASNLLQQGDISSGRNGRIRNTVGNLNITGTNPDEYEWIFIRSNNDDYSVTVTNNLSYEICFLIWIYHGTFNSNSSVYRLDDGSRCFVILGTSDYFRIQGQVGNRGKGLIRIYLVD